ncbi:MAG: antibiotic biosynthesis monooxygenase [Alphaproteobacteria bacterium]|nr:antibiotic biosynthesis monooxygenase [Alphaproteobacteria bacterium]
MFAVAVTFKINSADWDRFMPLMLENAQASLHAETQCKQFDVCTDPARPLEVFLYELYDDADAFRHHLESDHFLAFDAAVADMIESKQVMTYGTVE